MKENNSRRQFLRNTALAGLSLGLINTGSKANSRQPLTVLGACNPTTLDYYGQGPFYTADAPDIIDNLLAGLAEPGTRLVISGRVQTLDCTATIANTIIDIWHANAAGAYDNTGFNLRGKTLSNAEGFYIFETVLPGKYLNGASYRPSHIHFKITPPGFATLTTQLYFEGDTAIPGDAAASITTGTFDATNRIIPLTENGAGKLEGTWDIAINGDGEVGIADLHTDKGLIYSASPNPFTNQIAVHYGVFQSAYVKLKVINLQGNVVATLADAKMAPGKFQTTWTTTKDIPNGHYFLTLQINDLQVHYVKIVKV